MRYNLDFLLIINNKFKQFLKIYAVNFSFMIDFRKIKYILLAYFLKIKIDSINFFIF